MPQLGRGVLVREIPHAAPCSVYWEVSMVKLRAVILAAGQGTRMKSHLPKVLHPLLGRPMVWHSVQAAVAVTSAPPVVVVGVGVLKLFW